jgi:hypothetical protein
MPVISAGSPHSKLVAVAIGLSVGAAVARGVAVGVGLCVGPGLEAPPSSDGDSWAAEQATRRLARSASAGAVFMFVPFVARDYAPGW